MLQLKIFPNRDPRSVDSDGGGGGGGVLGPGGGGGRKMTSLASSMANKTVVNGTSAQGLSCPMLRKYSSFLS